MEKVLLALFSIFFQLYTNLSESRKPELHAEFRYPELAVAF